MTGIDRSDVDWFVSGLTRKYLAKAMNTNEFSLPEMAFTSKYQFMFLIYPLAYEFTKLSADYQSGGDGDGQLFACGG